ncbi:MAG: hypothetical protein R2787_09195 [Saprospiraceae bacterium]
MIDWVRLDLTGQVTKDQLEKELKVEFQLRTFHSGNQYFEEWSADILGMKVIFKHHGKILLEGSIHKFWNRTKGHGDQNWNLFRFQDCVDAITMLSDTLGIDPKNTTVRQFEYGINIPLGRLSATRFIEEALVCHQNKGFDSRLIRPGEVGVYADFVHADFYIKVYDKGIQYRRPDQILRFEVKTRRSEFNERLGVFHLSDLMDREVWFTLVSNLTKRFESDLLVIDPRTSWTGTPQQLVNVQLLATSGFWESMSGQANKRNRQRARKVLSNIDQSVQPLFSWHEKSLHLLKRECAKLYQTALLPESAEPEPMRRLSTYIQEKDGP